MCWLYKSFKNNVVFILQKQKREKEKEQFFNASLLPEIIIIL